MRQSRATLAMAMVAATIFATTAGAIDSPQTFTLLEVSLPKNDRPLGDFSFDRPPAPGDRFATTNALYRLNGTKRGERVGRAQVMHTFVTGFGRNFSHKATVLFVAQLYLPGGTLLLEGYGQVSPDGPSRITFPVIGGTGIYANAGGYMNFRSVGESTRRLEIHLVP
jgi:hypothetical protein